MTEAQARQIQTPLTSRTAPPRPEPGLKETLESIVIAFILAFVFRAYVVEAFVIPTGSMAPTLLGRHHTVHCAQCGYRFALDVPERDESPPDDRAVCPMCRFPNPVRPETGARNGDRILVHKYIYTLSEPRRWDVVVFKAPHDPDTNFIKRLLGLPGESLHLLDGNLWVKPPGGQWAIARKTDPHANRQWQKIQRTAWQPIYDSRYLPLDGGSGDPARRGRVWRVPWVAAQGAEHWAIEGRRSYHHDGTGQGALRFDFARGGYTQPEVLYAYNQFKTPTTAEPIEDVRVAAGFEPHGPGLAVTLQTTARLDNPDAPPQTLTARVDAAGRCTLEARDPRPGQGRTRELTAALIPPLPPGRTTDIELWFVDDEASLWVNGNQVLTHRFDLTLQGAIRRPPPAPRPEVRIGVEGPAVTLHRVSLDRDLYYSDANLSGQPARGALARSPRGTVHGDPVGLGPDAFFCVGDNAPWSHDSRYWDQLSPWIAQRMFPSDTPEPLGIVPRQLMIGRAFFVYFPAPLPLARGGPGLLPNFADMRAIH